MVKKSSVATLKKELRGVRGLEKALKQQVERQREKINALIVRMGQVKSGLEVAMDGDSEAVRYACQDAIHALGQDV
jgi:hypothetical protein